MQAQSCNCDVTLTGLKQTSLNLIWASQTNYSPGDTICIPVGSYRGLRFYDFEGHRLLYAATIEVPNGFYQAFMDFG